MSADLGASSGGGMRQAALALWRHLPVGFRQRLAHGAINLMTPRLGAPPGFALADRTIPRIVAGFLSSPSGLGQSARLTARALTLGGYRVHGIDLSSYFYEGAGLIDHGLPDGRDVIGPAHIIIAINAPYMRYALTLLGRRHLKDRHVTGYWAWELPRAPESWRAGLSAVHDIAVPSRFTADAVASLAPRCALKVAAHPVGLDFLDRPITAPETSGPFTVVSTQNLASGFVRKNPRAVVRAFTRAFGGSPHVRLNMLATNPDHFAAGAAELAAEAEKNSAIAMRWDAMPQAEFAAWWGRPQAYLAMHRAEGFGLGLAEALCGATPVVATGWSGNMDFMTAANSDPVRYRLIDVVDEQGKYPGDLGQWADADIDDAAERLARLHDERAMRAERAVETARAIRAQLSAEAFVAALCG